MNAATEFDPGPLTWVKGEIDLALDRAEEALRPCREKADPTQFKFCRTHVHQVHGALAIVGLDGLTQITENVESLLQALEDNKAPATPEAFAALDQALATIRRYLDDLMAGEPNQPLRLFPAYQALAVAAGRGDAHPTDLFYPDLSLRPPKGAPGPAFSPDEALAAIKAERSHFQKGLLTWLKQPEAARSALGQMQAALAGIEATQDTPAARTFWWISRGLLEALAERGGALDGDTRHMLTRIDMQIRRLLEGSNKVAERLMRDALYYVAMAPQTEGGVSAEVRRTFELDALVPSTAPAQPAIPQEAQLRRLRETLGSAEELWNKFCAGSSGMLAAFADHARTCAALTAEIGQTDLKRLGQGLAAIANWLQDEPARHSETMAMEVATAILLLLDAQENFKRLGTEFAQQVDLMVARLHACIAGKPAGDEAALPALDAMTRRAQEKLLVSQVAREIQNNLLQVEQALDAFFRSPSGKHDLAQLDGPLKQIGGALTMLGHEAALASLEECAARIRRFAAADYSPAAEDFEAVARQLSVLGFFIDALQHGETDFAAFARKLSGETPAAAEAPAGPVPEISVETEVERQKKDAQALAEALREQPEDERLKDELKQNLQALQKDADLVADRALGESAKAALSALEAGTDAPALDAALASLGAAQVEAPTPSAETLELAQADGEAIDAELLAIFIEEARDVLAAIADNLARLQADAHDTEALTTIRRSTHTLKGSGRMVGLTDLGETAWALEQTINLWLRQEQLVTPELIEMIRQEEALFSAWVAHLEGQAPKAPDPAGLIALAESLRGVDTMPAVPPPAPMVVPPEEEPQPTAQIIELPVARATQPAPAEVVELAAIEEAVPAPSPTLYDIFRAEARTHLDTLHAAFADLERDPVRPTEFEMTRAAHTLGGIAATVGLMPINKLAITLEYALLRRDGSARPDSVEGLETVRQAILGLDDMFATLQAQRAPEQVPSLIEALEEIYPPAPAPETPPEEDKTPAGEEAAAPAPQLQDELDEQLLPIFLEEAQDLLPGFAEPLRAWRESPHDDAPAHALARLLHTFKGSARMAGAMNLGEQTHALEARIEEVLRSGAPTPARIEEIEAGCDALVQAVEQLQGMAAEAEPPAIAATEEMPAAAHEEHEADAERSGQRATLRVRADLIDQLVNDAGELSIARARIEGEMRSLKGSLLDLTENVIRLRRQLRDIEIQAETQMQAHVAQSHEVHADFDPLELDRFTRFQELTRFMAESVNDVATVQQNLLKNLDEANAAILAQARLNRGLQQQLMGVRMLPFASQSERLYRIVRQAAKETGKRANLDIRGGQVEIDRSVLDKILAPLEHMLRNAVSHGIEGRDERNRAGKPEIGEITLSLAQEGNEIILTLADDGHGLDPARIRARAEELGFLSAGAAAGEAELLDLIFQPGFSTADKVTQLAGRGVGMDVVRTEVAALGGRVEIASRPGQGTTFRLYLPLTLAVTQTLLVRVGTQTYAIPSNMIEQVQELKEKALAPLLEKNEVEWMGKRYPIHFLPHLLGDGEAVPEKRLRYWLLLLRSGTQRVAIQVDDLQGNQEVVVKNIGPQLARVVGIAGATVLGDGRVVLILNPVALAGRARGRAAAPAMPSESEAATPPTVLVVDDSLTVRKIAGRLLAREGYQVVTAKDGVDALEQLLEVMPDVVLSDIEMPRMDGFDLVRNIRADARLKDLPIIMITSRTAEKHRSYAFEIGANHYLGKPYDEAELLGLIKGYVERR